MYILKKTCTTNSKNEKDIDLIEKKNHNSNVTRKETDDHKEPMTLS